MSTDKKTDKNQEQKKANENPGDEFQKREKKEKKKPQSTIDQSKVNPEVNRVTKEHLDRSAHPRKDLSNKDRD